MRHTPGSMRGTAQSGSGVHTLATTSNISALLRALPCAHASLLNRAARAAGGAMGGRSGLEGALRGDGEDEEGRRQGRDEEGVRQGRDEEGGRQGRNEEGGRQGRDKEGGMAGMNREAGQA